MKYNIIKRKGIYRIYKKYLQPLYIGIVKDIYIVHPKKPNSANRKGAKVYINNIEKRVYIPGEKHNINIHNRVGIINKNTKDLPGYNLRILRGYLESNSPIRKNKRSKYGTKRVK